MLRPVFSNMPYDDRNVDSAGKYRGIGQPGKVGMKKGTFTETPPSERLLPKNAPPRKMN